MKLLEDRIVRDGRVLEGNVLLVDRFLNQQIDVELIDALAKEFARRFAADGVQKVLTVEASGIGVAALTAQALRVPMVFAKKTRSTNLVDTVYSAPVRSYTHGNVNTIMVSKEFIKAGERILLIDDFLAHGEALKGLVSLVGQGGAAVVGAGIVIEKSYQGGGEELRAQGLRIESLARISSMSIENGVTFAPDPGEQL